MPPGSPISLPHRILGPHGVLWALVIAGGLLWFSAREGWVCLRDAAPWRTSPLDALNGDAGPRRWVTVRGVAVRLDRDLLGAVASGADGENRILVDPRDPSAPFWRELARMVESFGPDDVGRAVEGEAGVALAQREAAIQDRLTRLLGMADLPIAERAGVIPRAALLVDDPWIPTEDGRADPTAPREPTKTSAPGANPDDDSATPPEDEDPMAQQLERYRNRLRQFVAAARAGIEPDVELTGRLEKLRNDEVRTDVSTMGTAIGELALRVDARPRPLPAWLAIAATLALMLVLPGFIPPPENETAPEADPGPPATTPTADGPGEEKQ